MGRRYYCDYCDKAFIDDIDARRKHLQSAYHLNLQKQHYESFKDPKEILAMEIVKTPCHRFLQTGYCAFAENCKYTHYSQEGLWNLKLQIDTMENSSNTKEPLPEIPPVDTWLRRYEKTHENGDKSNGTADSSLAWWTYPEKFESRTDLPPSIAKFNPDDFTDSDFAEWGL